MYNATIIGGPHGGEVVRIPEAWRHLRLAKFPERRVHSFEGPVEEFAKISFYRLVKVVGTELEYEHEG